MGPLELLCSGNDCSGCSAVDVDVEDHAPEVVHIYVDLITRRFELIEERLH